jgi:hypothetical protein
MKQKQISLIGLGSALVITAGLLFSGCDKNNDVTLPPIGGYNNSDEVGAANLKGYWGLDGNGLETKSGATPTSSVGATYVNDGVRNQALSLANGYLYYTAALAALTTNQPFTVSAWVMVTNTGSAPTNPKDVPYQYLQLAIPGQLFGNFNGLIEAGQYKSTSDTLSIKSIYKDLNGGTQDNINNYGIAGTEYMVVKKAGTGKWVHIVTTYNPAGGVGNAESIFRIYADGVLVSNKNFENRHANYFKYTAGETIIGAWYNNIPGKTVSSDTWTVPFNGKIDEIRIWNKLLPESDISALYELGNAHR